MVLSPQCFHNLNSDADVFNHGNVSIITAWSSTLFTLQAENLTLLEAEY